MSLEKCPKCKKESLIKTPRGRIMRESLGCMLHIADEHSFDCLDINCDYRSSIIRINNKLGDKFLLPWWKRLFI
jgi:hypothetical protein